MTDILRLSVPLAFWLATFSSVYGLHGLVCSSRWAGAGLNLAAGRWLLVLAAAASVALQALLLVALRHPRFAARSDFVRNLSLTLATVALVAAAWTLLPVATTSACL